MPIAEDIGIEDDHGQDPRRVPAMKEEDMIRLHIEEWTACSCDPEAFSESTRVL
jgi:hypothetical protein